MSISHQRGARGLERLIWLKYYTVLKLQITFNLGLNATKNICITSKKGSNKRVQEITIAN